MVGTFRAALKKHHNFVSNAIGVSIGGICSLDATVIQNGSEYSFAEIIATVANNNNVPFFSSIEPTKKTESEGWYILVMTKPKLDTAKKAFDRFTKNLAKEGILNHFAMPGYSLERINHFKSMKMQTYADGLAAKYKIPGTIEVPKDAPSPHCNAWKQQPHIKFDLDNFPKMQSKKA